MSADYTEEIAANLERGRQTAPKARQDLNWLFELLGVADYGETRHVPAGQAGAAIEAARKLVNALTVLIRGE